MAKMDVILPDDLQKKLDNLGKNMDRIAAASLEAAAKPVLKAVLESYDRVAPRPLVVKKRRMYNYGIRSTGDLRRHFGISQVLVNRKGDWDIKIGVGKEKVPGTKISYGRLVALIEAGCKKRNQPARPFMKTAKRISAEAANAEFIRKFNEEVAKV